MRQVISAPSKTAFLTDPIVASGRADNKGVGCEVGLNNVGAQLGDKLGCKVGCEYAQKNNNVLRSNTNVFTILF
jgi:hypothetical protein